MRLLALSLFAFLLVVRCVSQDHADLLQAFDRAAQEFGVPADILKSIAFSESRWQHLEWPEGDTVSCTGLPHVYGVMALRDDAFFGRSLREGATLVGESIDAVKHDPATNVRAAAAFLMQLYRNTPPPVGAVQGSLESWQNAIARYCGIPQIDLAAQHAFEILERLQKGYDDFGIRIVPRDVNMTLVRQTARQAYAEAARVNTQLQKSAAQPDYPLAKWAPAYPGHWYTTGYDRKFVVIHDMEGYYLSSISFFQLSTTGASIHYDINGLQDSQSDGPAGEITQQVEEQYYAWHAVCLNRYSFGLEHEGFVSNTAWWTPEMYVSSANLVKYLCDKYSIPKDRNHIIGHDERLNSTWVSWANANAVPVGQLPADFATCNSHTDPGANWDWSFYMQLITGDLTAPKVTSTPPATGLQVYDKVTVTFNQRMERASTQANFRITPSAAGTFSWTNNSRTLAFTPTAYFPFAATYTVTVDTGARNYNGVGLDVNNDGVGGEVYSFEFHTVQLDTIPPQLTETYPAPQQTSISPSVEFIVDFNEPLDPASITLSDFSLRDSAGAGVGLAGLSSSIIGTTMRVRLRPSAELVVGATYTLTILPAMVDYGGNSIDSVKAVTFTTEIPQSLTGPIVDAMDAIGNWKAPSYSGSTVGVNATFDISTTVKHSGTGSGRIVYTFTGTSGGVLREYSSGVPSIDSSALFGLWIYGDKSMNELRVGAYYYTGTSTANFVTVTLGTIDWTGWKLKTIPLSSILVGNGMARKFAGLLLYQQAGGQTSGTIYFDEMRRGNTLTEVEEPVSNASIPSSIVLEQNYPNPFNPNTVVSYQLSVASRVDLRVYDVLGREVAVLVDEEQSPGAKQVRWDARGMTSGIYFYQLRAGGNVITKKMILLR